MARYLIRFDTPIQLVHRCDDGQSWDIQGFEDVPLRWTKTAEQTIDGQRRLYYAACAPYRVLVVSQNGTDIRRFQRSIAATGPAYVYASALVGWDDGTKGYVLPGQEGRRHTKISIHTMFTFGNADQPLVAAESAGLELVDWSELLRSAPRADQRGGYRGSQGRQPLDADEETMSVRASVPASYVETLRSIGDGNVSLGLRRLVESAQPGSDQSVTVASRHVMSEQVAPAVIDVDGLPCLDVGDGVLAETLAAGVEAGAMPGRVLRRDGRVYYYRPGSYDDLRVVVMVG